MLTDAQLLKYYTDKTFPGAFAGALNFQMFLKTELNENVPMSQIYKVLQQQPFYMYTQKKMKRFPRRKYDVKGFLELVQCDLAVMYACEEDSCGDRRFYKYFLLITDVFSSKIWAYPMQKKDSESTKAAFKKWFSDINNQKPTQISTDQGTEFKSLKAWLNSMGILLTYKFLNNKANFSEHGIFLVKNRLFKLLRYKVSDDWVKYLPYVVAALNKRPLESIGFLTPDDIHSEFDNTKVQESQKKAHSEPYREPDWQTQQKLQQEYEKSPKNKFQVGTFVYLDNPQDVFQKSFHVQVLIFSYIRFFSRQI